MAVKNVRLAQATLDIAERLIQRLSSEDSIIANSTISEAENFVRHLQSDAYYARLDGRSARAITLNRLADKIARARNDLRVSA